MTSSENFGNKMNYLFKRMNSFLSLNNYKSKMLKFRKINKNKNYNQ